MSFFADIADAIEDMGGAGLHDLRPKFPEYTLKQISRGIINARRHGLIEMAPDAAYRQPRYVALAKPRARAYTGPRGVASVWEYAQRCL